MLLRFSVSNFGSLRDKQELSMIASHAIKDDAGGLIERRNCVMKKCCRRQ